MADEKFKNLQKIVFWFFHFTSKSRGTFIGDYNFCLTRKQPHCKCLILIQPWNLECQLNDYVDFLELKVVSTNYWPLCLQLTTELSNSLCCFRNKSQSKAACHLKWHSAFYSDQDRVKEADPAMKLWLAVFRHHGSPLLVKSTVV